MNVGERGEILLKIKLTRMRDQNESINGETIVNVGFSREYGSISIDEYNTLDSRTDEELNIIAQRMNIHKAGIRDKADVFINNVGYSVKSSQGSPPALVNHTNRKGFEFVCSMVGSDISELDEIIDEYWRLRLSGIIREDIPNSDPHSPFREHKELFRPILEFFLFRGSGANVSKYPAEYILEYADPFDVSTWRILNKKMAVDDVWDNLVFSMRSKKGMPQDYTPSYRGKGASSILMWVREVNGEYKGALHIRVREGKKFHNQTRLYRFP